MYLNNFSVRVPEGAELAGGYIEMEHGAQYSLRLRNGWSARRCDAQVKIDGKHIGTFRIGAGDSISIERPVHDTGRFTFYKSGTKDAKDAGLDQVSPLDLGLIEVVFTPEQLQYYTVSSATSWSKSGVDVTPMVTYRAVVDDGTSDNTTRNVPAARCYYSNSEELSSGGTGLSGISTQNFENAQAILYDYSLQTTIHLRLVTRKHDNRPRPLTQFSNPIPPVVGK